MPSTPKLVQILALGAAAVAALFLALAIAPGAVGYRSTIVTDDGAGAGVPVGSVAIGEIVPVDEIAPGDKVTYRLPGAAEVDVGRVVEVDAAQGRLAVAGSAESGTLLASGWTFPRVRWVIPIAGHIAGAARSPAGIAAIVVLLLVGLMAERSEGLQELVAEAGEGPAGLEPSLRADPLPASAPTPPAAPAHRVVSPRRAPPPPPPPPPRPDTGADPASATRPPPAPAAPDAQPASRPALRSVVRSPEPGPTVRELFADGEKRLAPSGENQARTKARLVEPEDEAAAPRRALPEE